MHVNIHMYECILIRVKISRRTIYTTVRFFSPFQFSTVARESIDTSLSVLTRDNDRRLFMRIIIGPLSRSLETPALTIRASVMLRCESSQERLLVRARTCHDRGEREKKERERGRGQVSFLCVRIVTQLTYVAMRIAYLSLMSIRSMNNSFYEAARMY